MKHTYQRHWYLPGGGVRRGETLEEAARREAREELGASLGQLRLFGVYTNFHEGKSDHVIVFCCDDLTLSSNGGWEIARSDFFPLDELPDDLSPGSRRRIAEYAAGQPSPAFGTW